MELVRYWGICRALKAACPIPDDVGSTPGLFLALGTTHDLPSVNVSADLNYLLRHGRVWVGHAGTDPAWRLISAIDDLPKFKRIIIDDYDACVTGYGATPYQPQFFFAPANTMRGRALYRRLKGPG